MILPLEFTVPESPSRSASSHGSNRYLKLWHGWEIGARVGILAVSAVLVMNTSVTLWALNNFGVSAGIGTLQTGPCGTIKRVGMWLHIAINVVSTTLLGASNYYMQCLCSPTRDEVDKSHSDRKWLDVGVQSVRNLRSVGRWRTILWSGLAMTSIPLHIM